MQQTGRFTTGSDAYTRTTFRALVDAIIPRTPELAAMLGPEQTIGALDLDVDMYVMWTLDRFMPVQNGMSQAPVPLSTSTAAMLNEAAVQYLAFTTPTHPPRGWVPLALPPFAALTSADRFRTIAMLERLDLDTGRLPSPYRQNPGFVLFMAGLLNILPLFGFYSEWPGYGTTKLLTPELRALQFVPPDWIQTKYPGPAYGYRDFRGFILTGPHEGGSYLA